MRYQPRSCPRPDCPAAPERREAPFLYQRKGFYRRLCDGRLVQRFRCLVCRRGFSLQTLRLDYRLHKPRLSAVLFAHLVSKVTHRQSARLLGCSRKTVLARLELLGRHARELHERLLEQAPPGLFGARAFQLDELETFEGSRRLSPLTVPVLIERSSLFVLHAQTAPLPARGGLRPKDRERKRERERVHGKRTSGSREAVSRCLEVLERQLGPETRARLETDLKASYASLAKRLFAERVVHLRSSSKLARTRSNPLFAINHTLAMLRDGLSRLVRRTWAGAKRRSALERHLWIWIVWRNYVRGITNKAPRTSPAMALGVLAHKLSVRDVLGLQARFRARAGAANGASFRVGSGRWISPPRTGTA